MFTTLKKIKGELESSTVIHPGHNYAEKTVSTLEEQTEGNPFLHFHKCEDFVEYRMQLHDKIRNTPYHPVLAKDLLR